MFSIESLPKIKHALHATQALFTFIAWCLTLAILTRPGFTGGQIAFIFALCFITIPALVYQVAVPIFPRARRFANVYAYAVIDILFTLLWFSAAVAVAAWTTAGLNQAKATDKDADGTCKFFGFGDTIKCNVSRADAAFGFFTCFLFAGTAAISIMFIRHYRQTGDLPGTRQKPAYMPTTDVMGKGAWSATVEERNSLDEPDERRKYGQLQEDDSQGLLYNSAAYGMQHDPHPGSQLSLNGRTPNDSPVRRYDNHVPSALSPDGYENEHSPAYQPHVSATSQLPPDSRLSFPTGNYDRV